MNNHGYNSRIILVLTIILLAAFTFAGSGCRLLKRDKQTMAEKKKNDADKKASAEYEKARKQHYKNQSKAAKKMMKQTNRKAAKFNKPMKRKRFSSTKCN